MSRVLSGRVLSAVVLMSLATGVARAQLGGGGGGVAQALASAKAMAIAGDLESAERRYTEILLSSVGPERTEASFGLAYVHHRRLTSGDTAGRGLHVDRVAAEYQSVEREGSRRLRFAAATNRGLLLAHAGNDPQAAEAFELAVRTASDSDLQLARLRSAAALSRVGEEFRAERRFREVLTADPANAPARLGLLSLFLRVGGADSTLALVQRWRADTAIAPAITESLLSFLESSQRRGSRIENAFIVELARNLAVRRMTLEAFDAEVKARLVAVVDARAGLTEPVTSIAEAFDPTDAVGYRVGTAADWWRSDRGGPGTRKAWHTLLRAIGDQFREVPEREEWARRYYEIALGLEQGEIVADADVAALRPLALIFTRRQDAAAANSIADAADRFVSSRRVRETLDSTRTLQEVRAYHVAVGSVLSLRREGAPDVGDAADRHALRMVDLSDRIQRTGQARPQDSPAMLTDLAISLRSKGSSDSARVRAQLENSLRMLNVQDPTAEASKRINTRTSVVRPRSTSEMLAPESRGATPAARRPTTAAVSDGLVGGSGASTVRATAPSSAARRTSPIQTALIELQAASDSAAVAETRYLARRDSIFVTIRAAAKRRDLQESIVSWRTILTRSESDLMRSLGVNSIARTQPLVEELAVIAGEGREEMTPAQAQELGRVVAAWRARRQALERAWSALASLPRALPPP